MQFFTGAEALTVESAKKLYRILAMQWHPDRGGDNEVMKVVNAEYHKILEMLNGQVSRDADDREHTYRYDRSAEQAVMDKLAETLRADLPGCEAWLIGRWLWLVGDTKPCKETIKALGYWWSGERRCWYWRQKAGYGHSRYGLDTIAWRYGCRVFDGKASEETGVATA